MLPDLPLLVRAKYLERITTPGTVGGSSQTGETPNWKSMRALRDPVTRQVLRGAVFLYKDLHDRAIPVDVVLPTEFLARASTNPNDMSRRGQLTWIVRASG